MRSHFSSQAAAATSLGDSLDPIAAALSAPAPGYEPSDAERRALLELSLSLPSHTLSPRQLCDLELIMNGGFAPLSGFLGRADYDRVLEEGRLADGSLWPMPVTLDVSEDVVRAMEEDAAARASSTSSSQSLVPASKFALALKDPEGNLMGVLLASPEDVWTANKAREAEAVFGGDPEHPAVAYLNERTSPFYVGGTVVRHKLPFHYDYSHLRHSPSELRSRLDALGEETGIRDAVAFQTRNPMHRAHLELVKGAAREVGAHALLHPVVGMTKPGDIDYHTRMKVYERVMPRLQGAGGFQGSSSLLSVLPLAMRMGGPREALWHALIRKNYGATHFIVGRDHAGPGSNSKGQDFYGPYEARDFAVSHEEEAGIKMVPFDMMVYLQGARKYVTATQAKSAPEHAGDEALSISGTEVRRRLRSGEDIPEWFSYPEVVEVLRAAHPPLHKQGVTIFFTGLSGSGKSTIAKALQARLQEEPNDGHFRSFALLDGDEVRLHLSKGLGFSREDRDTNIERIGYVASEITKARGVTIACAIAPFAGARSEARRLVERHGRFVLVHVDTPLEECARRDRKGLYKKSARGELAGLTGVDDPYECPVRPDGTDPNREQGRQAAADPSVALDRSELCIDTTAAAVVDSSSGEHRGKGKGKSVAEAVDEIVEYLKGEGVFA